MFQSPKKEKTTTKETDKEIATKKGEPYIKVIDTNVDPKNPKYLQTIRGEGYVLWIE